MIIGIIADGNRRWAKGNNYSAKQGHQKGFNGITDEIFPACYAEKNCTGLVVYGFSTENWKRSPLEIANLMQIYSDMCDRWKEIFEKNPVRLKWCGRRTKIPKFLKKKIENIENKTQHEKKFTLYLCLDYGAQDEIQRAIQQGGENFENFLEIPPLDLVIRTGGEQRLSNFCLYQAAYAELFFEKKFLPEFTKSDMEKVIKKFLERERRKGGDK